MKADKIYHCFACGVGGDAIDFTARLCYRAHYNKLIFHFSGKIKEVLA